MALGHYILADDGKTPIRCTFDEMIAHEMAHKGQDWRRVALHEANGVKVSTVFLTLDHRFGQGAPLLWETMIFGGEHDGYCDRYSTHEEVIAGHARAVALTAEEARA